MKIAMIVPGGVDPSGEYRVIPALLALIRRLAVAHELHIFSLRQQPQPASWELAGARIRNIGEGWTRARAVAAILREHRRQPFDVVHSIWSGACGSVAVAAGWLTDRPSIVHVAGGELAAIADIRYGGALQWRSRLIERLNLRGASLITAASAPVMEQVAALGLAAQRVPLGVDTDVNVWPVRAPRPRSENSVLRLIHVASLNAVKDQATLLRAMRSLKRSIEFTLDIVGEDTLHGRVQALAVELGLGDCVRFHGFLPQRPLRTLMEQADLNLVSSRHEAGPLVLLEAAVAGVPTVGTRVGHLIEWEPDAAVTVPVAAPEALAAAIWRMASNEDLRLSLAAAAQVRAVREAADYTALQFELLYRKIIENARQGRRGGRLRRRISMSH